MSIGPLPGASDAAGELCRPVLYDESNNEDVEALRELTADPAVVVVDGRSAQRADLADVVSLMPGDVVAHPGCWVYYPWRRTLVGVLGEDAFRMLRLDRNRNKITRHEQERLGRLRIGVVGLSVGHAVAHTLALEGLCGELRLADFDAIEASNLNRIPATLLDLGLNKAVVAARRIAELDPYLDVTVFRDGVTHQSLSRFLDGLDILIEECDSLDLKVMLREGARRRGIPVLMETSDRGLLDVERFDLEPHRPLFHGLLGDVDSDALRGLSTKDKVPHVLRILGATELSARMAASMVEVSQSLTTWPQLGSDVALGGAVIAAAVRRLGLGQGLASGRIRIDLEEHFEALDTPPAPPAVGLVAAEPEAAEPASTVPATAATEHPATSAVLEAIRRAPSGGNIQPWRVESDPTGVRLYLDRERTTTMDVDHRGSYVALGAALFNARTAASAATALGPVALFPDATTPHLAATLRFGQGSDDRLTRCYARVLKRGTNRTLGRPRPLTAASREALREAALNEGGRLHLIEPGADLAATGEALAAADRVRYLTATLHKEMFAELVWPGTDRLDVGIDVRTLGLDAADLAKLAIAQRPEVMALLADWDAGNALAEDTRDRVASSSALAVVTVAGSAPADFVRGGSAVESVWLGAEDHGLSVHPVSPVFLFAVSPDDLQTLSDRFAGELARLQASFRSAVGLAATETVALVLRLSHSDATPVRSQRLPLGGIHRTT